MKAFGLRWALLNGYERIVNGELIHANRLAFGGTEGYLCIEAAPGQMVRAHPINQWENSLIL